MKRPHEDGSPEEEEDEGGESADLLVRLLSGDDFVGADEQEARQAEIRRQRRRERLALVQQEEGVGDAEGNEDVGGSRSRGEGGDSQRTRLTSSSSSSSAEPVASNDAASIVVSDHVGTKQGNSSNGATFEPGHFEVETAGGANAVADQLDGDGDGDDFDMFSSSTPVEKPLRAGPSAKGPPDSSAAGAAGGGHQEDLDDAEGYYKASIGEVIELEPNYRLRVAGVIGKGVFSTVLKCHVEADPVDATGSPAAAASDDVVVALKCVRHNDTMAKAALQEIQFLQQLSDAPSGIVKLLRPQKQPHLYYRGHVILVMAYREYNLRTVLQKFGRGVGLSLTAVKSYFCQLLSALLHLQTKGILHADLKPDNILVSSDFDSVQIGDFGSALSRTDHQSSIPTPYLVSRFYRAPEIILGIVPLTHGIDTWSLAVTIAELFTGSVLFRGRSNNEMLRLFQQVLRVVFPNKILRQHMRECDKHRLPAHFVQQGTALLFQQQTVDPVTKVPYSKHVHLQQLLDKKTPSLSDVLHRAAGRQQGNVGQLADLLHKCMALDPAKRIDTRSALKHEFFQVASRAAGDGKQSSK